MPCSVVLCSALQWRLVLFRSVQWNEVLYSEVLYSAIRCSSVLFSSIRCCAVQFRAVKFRAVYLSLLCTRPGNARPPPAFSKDWSWPGDLSDVPGSGQTAKRAQLRSSALSGALRWPSRPCRGCRIWQIFSPLRAGELEGWRARSLASGPVDDLQKSPLVGEEWRQWETDSFLLAEVSSFDRSEVSHLDHRKWGGNGPWNILESPRISESFLFWDWPAGSSYTLAETTLTN